MKNRKHLVLYIVFDYLAGILSWFLFFYYRKIYIESPMYGYRVPVTLDTHLFLGLLFIPFLWLFLHFLSGYYRNILRKSRLKEMAQTFTITILGVVILHFTIILNDITADFTDYYKAVFVLFSLQFLLTYLPRFIHTTWVHHRIISGPLAYRTILVGTRKEIEENYHYLKENKQAGNLIVGLIPLSAVSENDLADLPVPVLGTVDDLARIVTTHHVEEVILTFSVSSVGEVTHILNQLIYFPLIIKAIPALYPVLLGKVKIEPLLDVPYLQLNYVLMPDWQIVVKTIFDYCAALIVLLLTLPVSLIVAVVIKITSKGPVIYSHERIGRHGKPFTIYKFRTMISDAEKNGPALSSQHDPRITPFGRFLRRTRLDEIPNFINVLKGDMSIVGPRPERKYFIDKIMKEAPEYLHLQKVKPGITSWGQVKYGYAENTKQMIERLQYDLNYIKNMSLYVDFKILILTLLTILKRKGK